MNPFTTIVGFLSQVLIGLPTSAVLAIDDDPCTPQDKASQIGWANGIAAGTSICMAIMRLGSRGTVSTMISSIPDITLNPFTGAAILLILISVRYLGLCMLPNTLAISNSVYSKIPTFLMNGFILALSIGIMIYINGGPLAACYILGCLGIRYLILASGANEAVSLSLISIVPIIGILESFH